MSRLDLKHPSYTTYRQIRLLLPCNEAGDLCWVTKWSVCSADVLSLSYSTNRHELNKFWYMHKRRESKTSGKMKRQTAFTWDKLLKWSRIKLEIYVFHRQNQGFPDFSAWSPKYHDLITSGFLWQQRNIKKQLKHFLFAWFKKVKINSYCFNIFAT